MATKTSVKKSARSTPERKMGGAGRGSEGARRDRHADERQGADRGDDRPGLLNQSRRDDAARHAAKANDVPNIHAN
jgi:hypothetical protein